MLHHDFRLDYFCGPATSEKIIKTNMSSSKQISIRTDAREEKAGEDDMNASFEVVATKDCMSCILFETFFTSR